MPGSISIVKAAPRGALAARLGAHFPAGFWLRGDIVAAEDLRIDGNVGSWPSGARSAIDARGCRLTIGAAANVTANITACEVVVFGKIKGNLRVRGRVEIKNHGSIVGQVVAARLVIEEGASFRGSVDIEPDQAAKFPSPAGAVTGMKRAAAGD